MLLTRLAELLARGARVVHVTVERAQGSTPREAGAAMLVLENGDFHGTIGGGALEWEALRLARTLFEPGHDRVVHRDFSLGPELAQCCGGRMALRFERFEPQDAARIARRAGGEADARTPLALFGAGHVGRAVVLALAPLPFRVTWIDPRSEAFPALVPANVEKHAPVDAAAEVDALAAGTFILVMTHSHPLDLAIVSRALAAGRFPFVGLIGSATKRARFSKRMAEAGLDADVRRRLVCPVGVDGIDSKEPAIIAASMAAALLRAREDLGRAE